MPESLTSLGVGGILVILILREVLPYFKKMGRNGMAGERSTDFWINTNAKILQEILDKHEMRGDKQLQEIITNQRRIIANQEKMFEELLRRNRGR